MFAEIGKNGDELTLVISADGIKKLFPDVQEIYAARPTVPGWKVAVFPFPERVAPPGTWGVIVHVTPPDT